MPSMLDARMSMNCRFEHRKPCFPLCKGDKYKYNKIINYYYYILEFEIDALKTEGCETKRLNL